jgi:hypothetical protein
MKGWGNLFYLFYLFYFFNFTNGYKKRCLKKRRWVGFSSDIYKYIFLIMLISIALF